MEALWNAAVKATLADVARDMEMEPAVRRHLDSFGRHWLQDRYTTAAKELS